MNYHIMVQDKFLDSYIDDIYEINEQDNNVFWFRGVKDQNGFIKTNYPVEYLGNDILFWKEKFSKIQPVDSIFVHWYDLTISKILYELPNPIYVMLWGGEFYNEPFWSHRWVFDKLTLRYLKQTLFYPKLEFTINLLKLYRDFKRFYFFKKELRNDYHTKHRYIGRIDYLISPTVTDYLKIKNLYPLFKAKDIIGFYDQNFDRAQLETTAKQRNNTDIHILLGNSGSESNNHLDALEKLKKLKNVKIYCPLSYGGSKEYINVIMQRGQDLFGDKFIPMKNFMTREEYMRFYDEIDIVFMYHNRQQAFGNICTALTKGKPVFLKKQNTIKDHLDALGIKTYNVNGIVTLDLKEIIKNSKEYSTRNHKILKATLSKEKRLSELKFIMDKTKIIQ